MTSQDVFEREVLRWNRSFSLVSRQDPEGQTRRLIRECGLGAEALAAELAELAPERRILYADLGTGGGFPGLLWARDLPERLPKAATWLETHLVEPREKRAWFLGQTARAMGLDGVCVHTSRWGDGVPYSSHAADLLIVSMKALHLPESIILAHAHAAFPGWRGPLLVVRFVTAEDARTGTWDQGLEIPGCPRGSVDQSHHRFALLADPGLHSSLLLSWHP